jgi:hypothetical protein
LAFRSVFLDFCPLVRTHTNHKTHLPMTDLELATLARIATALEKIADAIEP